ncbi:dienelactone hydrolase family protein [Biformimicrobium ophioploci]|uniref:Dienelactone hydrolase family protein n=1 Tax=Biformimicrobium ophioploci TaxID=3036711 RepID=A0ABQ6LZW7_9GAMM|nr:dienelactone hydrolase family protein [Microbulbifer sp. NKW57]GMG87641.1 dienelactone hydrolase family protein [Microbulbifer sp. NKW57]
MCDELSNREAEAYFLQRGLSRRDFGKFGVGAALATIVPMPAFAQDLVETNVEVETPDGKSNCYFVHPAKGKHPAVILWPDIFGTRPAYRAMGKRLAAAGYAVLVVNPYYRTMKEQLVPDDVAVIGSELRKSIWPDARKQAGTLSTETCLTDGRAFIAYLDKQAPVDTAKKVGTMGYCMTGSYTFRLAADMPERIGAGASFHGGRLVTDKEDSPHRLVPEIKAGFLVAIAENDDEKKPEAKVELRKAFDNAGLEAEIEVYEDTLHGWCPSDSMAHNREQAERAWSRLLALFERNLV